MPYIIHPTIRKDPASYAICDFMTKEGCEEIINLSKIIPVEKGKTHTQNSKRVSEIYWIEWQKGVDSLFKKLEETVRTINDQYWNFNLTGFIEPLQLTHYKSQDQGRYDWHADQCDVGVPQCRKISGTLLLNDGFSGGDFQLFDTPDFSLKQGQLILFPSYKVHRVLPVSSGERWSLVFWVSGPPFC